MDHYQVKSYEGLRAPIRGMISYGEGTFALLEGGKCRWDGGEWNWMWQWKEELSNSEADKLVDVEEILEGVRPNSDEEDKRRWIADSSDIFAVQSYYNFPSSFNSIELLNHNIVRALQELWSNDVQSKIDVFGWRLLQNKLVTREELF
ncbi:putative ribonuclease H protein, partial [Trifolium medium]|nr:putative ribonuclease H protein [Trifolium medium]